MKKRCTLFIVAICLLTLWGCTEMPQETSTITTTITTTVVPIEQIMKLYEDFLSGEQRVNDQTGYTIHADSIFMRDNGDPSYDEFAKRYTYAYFDMNGDDIPELHVRGVGYVILTYASGELIVWCSFGPAVKPLNNGAVLNELYSAEQSRISYYYLTLDFYGNVQQRVDFRKVNSNRDDIYDETSEYWFGDKEVSKEEWEALTEPYLSIGSDKIEWIEYKPQ